MNNFKIPSLILWGRHDGVFPVALSHEAYDNIGSDNKYIHIFENSAHNPNLEEPELFVESVKIFVDKYK
jgi:proline iminopeptidase